MSSLMPGSLEKRMAECQESLAYIAESGVEGSDKMYV